MGGRVYSLAALGSLRYSYGVFKMKFWEAIRRGIDGELLTHRQWPKDAYIKYVDGQWINNRGTVWEFGKSEVNDGWEIYDPPQDWLQRAMASIDSHDAGVLECRIAIGFLVKHLRSK